MSRKHLPPLLYAGLILYASLFPFGGWRPPEPDLLSWLHAIPGRLSKSDLLVNVVAYVPLGFLVMSQLTTRGGGRGIKILLSVSCGLLLSFTMETTQTFLPSRTPSVADLLTNTAGTALGTVLAHLWRESAHPQGRLGKLLGRHLLGRGEAELGLFVLLSWAMSQLAPFVPALDLGGIKSAVKPLWQTFNDFSLFRTADAATYCCYLTALGVVAQCSIRPHSMPLALFGFFACAVLLAKAFVLGRQLSLESFGGLLAAALLWVFMSMLSGAWRRYVAMALLLAGFALYESKAGAGSFVSGDFNWIPFSGALARELSSFGVMLEGAWPFAALSFLFLQRFGRSVRLASYCGALLLLFVFVLEWRQLLLPGRFPDITQVLLALTGWLAPYFYLCHPRCE